jgi:cation diffusion facilitator family transporter
LSIILNILLFVLKYWAGIVSGSVSLIADAWHTLTDSLSSIILLVGIKISEKKPDKKRPFGYGRAELISSIIIGVLLAMIGFQFFNESVHKLIYGGEVLFGKIAIIVTIASLVVKETMAQYSFYIARKSGSISLKADAWHHRSDAISSLVILVGIFISPYIPHVDGVLGIIVSGFIFYSAFEIFKESVSPILGEEPSSELKETLNKISSSIEGFDVKLHHVHIHDYGKHVELTCHIVLPGDMKLIEANNIAKRIEDLIFKETGMVSTIKKEPLLK